MTSMPGFLANLMIAPTSVSSLTLASMRWMNDWSILITSQREAVQVAQRRVTGTEVIEIELDGQFLQVTNPRRGMLQLRFRGTQGRDVGL